MPARKLTFILIIMLSGAAILSGCTSQGEDVKPEPKPEVDEKVTVPNPETTSNISAPMPPLKNSTSPVPPVNDLEGGKEALLDMINRTIDMLEREGARSDIISELESLKEKVSSATSMEELREIMEEFRAIQDDAGIPNPEMPKSAPRAP
ncbi:hypothetical protein [Archaeoglobus fulgidus]|uniref:Uncharacterized protein AF_1465 n=1 Tax=Archaeoglobus fulgidus (strain ATCC 49558 / DSM 4304 / JCM 9628 / NBRC 100126 / VC-16) TaxID=224325 RepID=Y1465_ARCFU|nr:hypothetical protein [Archaeoglobus fulgidus]O28807.1 RecName: Full=Uncharacterized protein AF_1465 [Archaeoglobus fulgidus DSM 4304]AAB89788.1 predicted coding region AF_1465 [Archaeoglobus fulgidus DSM 4304]